MNAAGRRSRSQNGRRSAHNHYPTRLQLPSRDTGSPTRSATAAAPRYGCPLATLAHRRVPRRRLLRGTAALSRHWLTDAFCDGGCSEVRLPSRDTGSPASAAVRSLTVSGSPRAPHPNREPHVIANRRNAALGTQPNKQDIEEGPHAALRATATTAIGRLGCPVGECCRTSRGNTHICSASGWRRVPAGLRDQTLRAF